ncbi:hypothetical protein [Chryseobacterium indologenes]|uniref:DUF5626 domain-containing protein n=1 Tax=Chryseobacterium indologenes TaxID=253 RepID=A0A0N0ZTJ0_CHRID|nr:hypothetical protein [Chryseobacterium indologenes]KPE50388.1 hypothetical protein AOB46_15265 [Chryseobacterium indologenes]
MKKMLTNFLAVLLTVVSVTCVFAQSSFSVKYVGEASLNSFPPNHIKVEADYNRHTHIISPPNSYTQTTPVLESKYITSGTTVAYLSPSTSNGFQTYELFHLKVTWIAYHNGNLISRVYTFNDLQILSANSGNEVDFTIIGARIRLKAISSGSHITYQITLQTY